MEMHGPKYVYRCEIPGFAEVFIGLRFVNNPELKKKLIEQQGLSIDELSKLDLKTIREHVDFIVCPDIDGEKIKTYEDLLDHAPPEITQWVEKAVYSSLALSSAERKN